MKGTKLVALLLLASCASSPSKPRSIRQHLEDRRDEFRSCYLESNSYQGRHEEKEGRVKVSFTIGSHGKVIEENIERSDFKDANLHACILDQIRNIPFDPPPQAIDGGIQKVTQDINLQRRKNE